MDARVIKLLLYCVELSSIGSLCCTCKVFRDTIYRDEFWYSLLHPIVVGTLQGLIEQAEDKKPLPRELFIIGKRLGVEGRLENIKTSGEQLIVRKENWITEIPPDQCRGFFYELKMQKMKRENVMVQNFVKVVNPYYNIILFSYENKVMLYTEEWLTTDDFSDEICELNHASSLFELYQVLSKRDQYAVTPTRIKVLNRMGIVSPLLDTEHLKNMVKHVWKSRVRHIDWRTLGIYGEMR